VCGEFYSLRDITIAAMTFSLLTFVGTFEWKGWERGLQFKTAKLVIEQKGEESLRTSDSNASEVGSSIGSGKEKIDV